MATTLPTQAFQIGGDPITLRVQRVLMTGGSSSWFYHRGRPLGVSNGFILYMIVSSECTGINQVAQSGGIVAIASSTIQGGDDSFPTVDNIGPSLIFWKENSGISLFSLVLSIVITNLFVGFHPIYTHTKFYGTDVIPPDGIGGGM